MPPASSPAEPAPLPAVEPAPGNAVVVPRCGLTAGDAHWIEEGQELALRISCRNGAAIPGEALTMRSLPPGATWDASQAEVRWIPRLDQAGVWQVAVTSTSGETATAKIGVADRYDHPQNVPIMLPAQYTEEMGLPVFHLKVDPQIGPNGYTPATLVYRGKAYTIEAKHKGNSSLSYPKKSFTLEFAKNDRFNEPELGGGFVAKKKIALRATFDDNSYLRDRLSYELWARIGSGKIQVQTYSAVVYLNGAYQGLYTVVDHIDEDLMEAQGLSSKGSIFKAVGPDANFYPHPQLSDVYEKTNGDVPEGQPGAFAEIEELTNFMNTADDESFASAVGQRLNVNDYTAWLILGTLIQAQDTLGKNSYHYHDPASGRWRVVPWDFNHSLGQDWMTAREAPNLAPGDLAANNRLFHRLWTDPVLGPDTRERYRLALEHEVALEDVIDLFDGMAMEIAPAAARDERRWRQPYLGFERWSVREDFTDFEGEIRYMRQWIRDRWAVAASAL